MTREAIYRELTLCACLDARLRAHLRASTRVGVTAQELAESAELVRAARAELALHWATVGEHV
jgi:hypothetical protein